MSNIRIGSAFVYKKYEVFAHLKTKKGNMTL